MSQNTPLLRRGCLGFSGSVKHVVLRFFFLVVLRPILPFLTVTIHLPFNYKQVRRPNHITQFLGAPERETGGNFARFPSLTLDIKRKRVVCMKKKRK